MKRGTVDILLKRLLGLSNRDTERMRDLEVASWCPPNGPFNPSRRSLRSLIRSLIENSMRLDKPQWQTAKKRNPRD
jgi:hypothetical protein